MTDQKKINAVNGYLESEFQGCKIRDGHDFNLDAQVFRITCRDSIYITGISDELLEDEELDASDISNLLQKSRLAEKLREVGNSNTCVIVTSKGLRLENE